MSASLDSVKKKQGFTLTSRKEGAFTLIELMVVIAIIAILATIGLVVYSSVQKTTRDSKRVQDVQEIQKALEQFYAANSYYPGSNGNTTPYSSAIGSYFQNSTIPTDPNGNQYYFYGCSNAVKYNVCAQLESCGSKCNVSTLPANGNGCSTVPAPASGNTYYCVSSLSN